MARRAFDPDDPDRMARELARAESGGGDNRYVVAQQQQQAFEAEKARLAAISPALANVKDFYDQSQIPDAGYAPSPELRVQAPDVGLRLNKEDLNPDGTVSIDALRRAYKGSGAEFEKIPFEQWVSGPSSPWQLNAGGTAATYVPEKQTYFPGYNPETTGLSGFMEKAIPGLAIGLMGAGALGALTNGAVGLAPGSLGAGASGAAVGDAGASAGGALGEFGGAGGGLLEGGFGALGDPMSGEALMQLAQTPSMAVPGIEGISSGALSGILGGAAPVVGGPLGALTLDAAGNIVPQLTNLANSATSLAGGAATVAGGGGLGGAGGGGGLGGAATTAAKTGLSKFLQDNLGIDVDPSTLGLLGDLLGTGLGVYGANQQANSMENLYDKFMGMGKPYRDSLAQLNSNPESFYSSPMVQGALQQGSDAMARSLSAKVGNPILNPTALQEMQNYTTRGLLDAYGNRWNQLSSAGQLGVSQSAPLGIGAANANADVGYTAGLGLKSVLGNQNNTAQQLGQALMKQFGLT